LITRQTSGGRNTWGYTWQSLNLSFAIAQDGQFVGFPITAGANGTRSARQSTTSINATIRRLDIHNTNNTLGDDATMTFEINGVATAGVITISAGVAATYSAINLAIPIVEADLIGGILGFDDGGELGQWRSNGSSVGGN